MDVSCYIRTSTLVAVYSDIVRQAIEQSSTFDFTPMAIRGAEDAFISGVVLQGVTLFDDDSLSTRFYLGGVGVRRDIPLRMDFVVYISSGTRVSPGVAGGLATTVAIGVRLVFMVSMSQPAPSDGRDEVCETGLTPPRAPTVLLLKAKARLDLRAVELQDEGTLTWERVFGAGPIAWFQAVVCAVAKIDVGALAPPINAANVVAIAGRGALLFLHNAARLVGDEVHFGSIFTFALPPTMVSDAANAFMSAGPQLNEHEDCAVVLGAIAATSLYYNIALAVGNYLFNNSMSVFSSQAVVARLGPFVRGTPLYTLPAETNVMADGTIRTELPFSMTGVCRGADTDVPELREVAMGLDLSLNAQLSLMDAAGLTFNATITIDADLDQDGVSRCYAAVLPFENWFSLLFWPFGLAVADGAIENLIVKSLVRGERQRLQQQLDPVGATFSHVGEIDETEAIQVTIPIRIGFDSFGTYAYDPSSIRSSRAGLSYRVSGSLPQRYSRRPAATVLLEARSVVPYFPLVFSPAQTLQGISCEERALPSIGFLLWNRSAVSATIYEIDVRSSDWELLFSSGGARWTPRISREEPAIIPPWGALRVRMEFLSLDRLDEVLSFSRDGGAFTELVVLVLSNGPPVTVHWTDPLQRIRDATADEIESARDLCRRGPLMLPPDPLLRSRDLDLFSEVQPDWIRDLSSDGIVSRQPAMTRQILPWESVAPNAHRRGELGPSVFTMLLQSMTQRR